MSKCKFWNPSGISPCIEIPQGCTIITIGLCILGVPLGSQDFATHFLDEDLFQDVVHIDDFPFLGNAHFALGIMFSCVVHQPFYFTWIIPPYLFLFFLVGFNDRIMQVCGDITGPRSWESFQDPLVKHRA
jgi:hypothetical protein